MNHVERPAGTPTVPGRVSYHLGVNLCGGCLEAVEVGGGRQEGQVQVAAKLRCAV